MREGNFWESLGSQLDLIFAPCVDENLFHFVSECEELSELRNECFGRKFGSECWLTEWMAERRACDIKQLCKFLRLGIKKKESCLSG